MGLPANTEHVLEMPGNELHRRAAAGLAGEIRSSAELSGCGTRAGLPPRPENHQSKRPKFPINHWKGATLSWGRRLCPWPVFAVP
jgi:hypothetical protein